MENGVKKNSYKKTIFQQDLEMEKGTAACVSVYRNVWQVSGQNKFEEAPFESQWLPNPTRIHEDVG